MLRLFHLQFQREMDQRNVTMNRRYEMMELSVQGELPHNLRELQSS